VETIIVDRVEEDRLGRTRGDFITKLRELLPHEAVLIDAGAIPMAVERARKIRSYIEAVSQETRKRRGKVFRTNLVDRIGLLLVTRAA
jgi:hypothetical protein